jgi:hypothetical protein
MTAPLTPRALRRFGLTVGGAFLVLGGISRWRGHEWPPLVLWTLAGALLVPALAYPAILAPIERAWMRLGAVLHRVNSTLILGIIFFLVITPIGMVLRLFRDPMDRRLVPQRPTLWVKRERGSVEPQRYRQPF